MKVYNIEDFIKPYRGKEMLDQLTLTSMKANYPSFVKEYGFDLANKHMGEMFKRTWDSHKEEVWQWYDLEWERIVDELQENENDNSRTD